MEHQVTETNDSIIPPQDAPHDDQQGSRPEGEQENILESKSLEKFKGEDGSIQPDKLGKAYLDLESEFGKLRRGKGDSVSVPAADAPEEEWNSYYEKIRPESVDAYRNAIKLDNVPDGMVVSEAVIEKVLPEVHKMGLTPKQFEHVFGTYMQAATEELETEIAALEEQQKAANAEGMKALKSDWPDYDKRMGRIHAFLRSKWGDQPEKLQALERAALGADPVLAKTLDEIIEMAGVDFETGQSGGGQVSRTEDQIKQEINKLRASEEYRTNQVERDRVEAEAIPPLLDEIAAIRVAARQKQHQ